MDERAVSVEGTMSAARRAGCAVLVALVVGLLGPVSAADAQSPRTCADRVVGLAGEGSAVPLAPHVWKVTATGVRCRRAVKVAQADLRNAGSVAGWSCGHSHFEVSCAKGDAVVDVVVVKPGKECADPGERVDALVVARARCRTGRKVARKVKQSAGFGPRTTVRVAGRTWRCRRPDGFLPDITQICFSGRRMLTFEVLD